MRQTALLFVIAVFGYAANAQLTLRPQIGIENPATKISYNELGSFAPVSQVQPQFGLHADYKFKSGFGPFIGLSTSRTSINYNFNDPATGMSLYTATMNKMQVALQAGVKFSSKPVFLNLHAIAGNCGSTSRTTTKSSGCHSSHSCCTKPSTQRTTPKRDVWTVSLQPSAGLSYIPTNRPAIESKTSGYTYNAGMKTAIVTGMSFEFAKNKTKFLTLSLNYFKGLGNNETTFSAPSTSASKMVTTTLGSTVSGWNASVGIPISFAKHSSSKSRNQHHQCGEQYRIRCQSTRKI